MKQCQSLAFNVIIIIIIIIIISNIRLYGLIIKINNSVPKCSIQGATRTILDELL